MFTILHSKYLRPGRVSLTSAFVLTVAEPTTLQRSLRQDENGSSTRPSPSFEIHKDSEVDELLHNNTNASSTAVNFETLVAQRFKERREHLEEQCSALREILPIQVHSLFMNALFFVKKYNFFTCITPKVGSSTWKVHLLRMKGLSSEIRDPHDFNQHIALKFRNEKPEDLLRSSGVTKVVTVRHPLSRLLSAFRNKLGGGDVITPDPAMFRFMSSVLRHFGVRAARGEPASVSFLDFMKFVVFQVDSGERINEHWRPYSWNCQPCGASYDYIVKLETFDDDLRFIANATGIKEFKATIRENQSPAREQDTEDFSKYFEDFPEDLLRDVYRIYGYDFMLFGYEIPSFLLKVVDA
ncbi:carbohydrate sulfotransferase 14-like [Penaeus chinensis]|uniref:carbohydrate sulfotransferase 14-like n=1 Tax=Penaeus chinensis TaxID=139456 RepID=UPI001FB605C2|nr:carbohydrate sulfotransferase 14-like [Penaeus chinensis]